MGDGLREGIREALIPGLRETMLIPLLKAIRLGPEPSDQKPQVQEEEQEEGRS